jgi:hypothetical protein
VLCNGSLHFIGHDDGVIMTFNVTDETFGTLVPPPPQGMGERKDDYSLTELDRCLCVYSSWQCDPKPECPYKIWLLRDYEAGCWEKLACVDWGSLPGAERASLGSEWIGPLGMYQSDNNNLKKKKIMFGTGKCQVFIADPSNGVPQVLFTPQDGMRRPADDDSRFPTMGFIEESLKSVGRMDDDDDTTSLLLSSPSSLVWSEVLTWLPTRMVGRLTQVSREWRAMTKDEAFIDKHWLHAKSKQKPPGYVL